MNFSKKQSNRSIPRSHESRKMKIRTLLTTLFTVLFLPLSVTPVYSIEKGIYGLTGLGMMTMSASGDTAPYAGTGPESKSIGGRIGLGYQVKRYLAFEYTFGVHGKVGDGISDWTLSTQGPSMVALLPRSESFSWLLKLGIQKASVHAKFSAGTSGTVGITSRDWRPMMSLGVQKDFSRFAGGRIEIERFSKVGDPQTTGQFSATILAASLYYVFE